MTFSAHTFYEVAWRSEPLGSVWYVSDPFGDIESAKHYAIWRTSQGYVAELWQVEKFKQQLAIDFNIEPARRFHLKYSRKGNDVRAIVEGGAKDAADAVQSAIDSGASVITIQEEK